MPFRLDPKNIVMCCEDTATSSSTLATRPDTQPECLLPCSKERILMFFAPEDASSLV
jgi:hypothetical protein